MSKPQTWLVAAVAGVVVLIAIRHMSGSAKEETDAPQRMVEPEAKTEHSGWSVRSKSGDLPTSDDVRVERGVEAKPGNIAPRPASQRTESQNGHPSGDAGGGVIPAQPDDGTDEPAAKAGSGTSGAIVTSVGHSVGSSGGTTGGGSGGSSVGSAVGGMAPNAIDTNGAPNAAANTQGGGGTQQKATLDQEAQPAPLEMPTPGDIAIGAMYDSKDTKFSIDTPVEVKDIGTIPGGVTMMMQLAPDWTPDSQDDADLMKLGDNLELTKNVHFLRLQYTDSTGAEHGIGTDMTSPTWQDIQPPYSIAATANGNQLDLVVNGKVVAQGTMDGATYEAPSNPTLQIGCDYPPGRPCASGAANGVLVVPPNPIAESIARTKPAQTGTH